jgi:hypothetical protein
MDPAPRLRDAPRSHTNQANRQGVVRRTRLGHSPGNHLKMKGRVSLFLVAEGVGGNGHFLIMC